MNNIKKDVVYSKKNLPKLVKVQKITGGMVIIKKYN